MYNRTGQRNLAVLFLVSAWFFLAACSITESNTDLTPTQEVHFTATLTSEAPTQTPEAPTAVPTPAPATYTSVPAAGVPDRVWLPFAQGGETMLVVHAGVVTREPTPARIDLFWDYGGSSGKLAYAAQFWHPATGKDVPVSDLWVYDYTTGQGERWLWDNVACASWLPIPGGMSGDGQLAVALFDTETQRLDLALVSGPGQVETLVEGASHKPP